MSTLTQDPPGLGKSADYWIDVEVPYNKIAGKWDRKYRTRLNGHMKTGRLQKRVLAIYFKIMGKSDDLPHDRSEALDGLEEQEMGWVYNLCSQFEFSTGISSNLIVDFADKAESKITDIGFEDELEKNLGGNNGNPNKDGLIALYQLSNPDLLREILIYSRASSRYPTTSFKRDKGGVPTSDQWSALIRKLNENNIENYELWCQFEHEGAEYVAIEEEDRDGVERQVGRNIEQEPANLIIMKFQDSYLDVYAGSRSTAGLVQSGVNEEIAGNDYEENRNPTTPDQIKDFANEISEKDRERDEDKTVSRDYVLTDLSVAETTLPNGPELKLSSDLGLGKAIDELRNIGYDILSDPNSIEKMGIKYKEYKFNIRNTERSASGSGDYRELVYGCRADPDTREEFEQIVSDEFGVNIKYESSQ